MTDREKSIAAAEELVKDLIDLSALASPQFLAVALSLVSAVLHGHARAELERAGDEKLDMWCGHNWQRTSDEVYNANR